MLTKAQAYTLPLDRIGIERRFPEPQLGAQGRQRRFEARSYATSWTIVFRLRRAYQHPPLNIWIRCVSDKLGRYWEPSGNSAVEARFGLLRLQSVHLHLLRLSSSFLAFYFDLSRCLEHKKVRFNQPSYHHTPPISLETGHPN